jgi:hypothetical protein
MSANRVDISRTDAQGNPVIVLRISGDDVVGDARVYLSLYRAGLLRDALAEEIEVAELQR